jgi:flagellar motor protein MotB
MSKRAKKAADYLVQMAYTHRKELFFEGGASVDPKLDNIVKKEREI